MSRIHEALKKAEQERASTTLGSASPEAYVPAESVADTPTEITSALRGGAATAEMPSLSASVGSDALLSRCVQQPWLPDDKTMLFFNGDDGVRGTEEFRTLRSRLYSAREKMPLKKVLITSALPKEGKSFTAANLAQVLVRQHGRRVLLIDADLRGPRLHMMLGTNASPGLSNYLDGGSDEFGVMQRGPMEGLFFIPCGNSSSDPADLVANGRMKLLLQRIEHLFDWIVVDSPPAVPVSDAGVLAKACDGVLIVVRSNATPVDMARRARLEFPDEILVGMVLNGTTTSAMPYTRYYYDGNHKNGSESKS